MFHYPRALLTIAITASLAACGGGGSSDSGNRLAEAKTMSGKVIDGYIFGATVFLDLNFNGVLDDGEPSAVTTEAGTYTLDLDGENADCGQYVPIVTHVPEGAIDLDFPDTPIEEEYTMVTPPSFLLTTDEDLLNLTPLTSIVWGSVEKELAATGVATLSCASIAQEQELRNTIAERLERQEVRIARRYNITVDELYDDYVATGRDDIHALAQALVPGLQASYAETLALEEAKPDMLIGWVDYYMEVGSDASVANYDYSDAQWYRQEYVYYGEHRIDEITNLVSSDLSEVIGLEEQTTRRTLDNGTYEFNEIISLKSVNDLSESNVGYRCAITEAYRDITMDVQYGVTNYADEYGYTNMEDCVELDRVANSKSQRITTRVMADAASYAVRSESTHIWADARVPEVIGVGDNIDSLEAGWLYNQTNFIDPDFNSEETYGSENWWRVYNEYENESVDEYVDGYQKIYTRNEDDKYTISYYYDNGTYTELCGTYPSEESELTTCTD